MRIDQVETGHADGIKTLAARAAASRSAVQDFCRGFYLTNPIAPGSAVHGGMFPPGLRAKC